MDNVSFDEEDTINLKSEKTEGHNTLASAWQSPSLHIT